MTGTELMQSLAADPVARLRWTVLRRLGIAPFSQQAKAMSDAECLVCAAHMALDASAQGPDSSNPAFDMDRFLSMKEAE